MDIYGNSGDNEFSGTVNIDGELNVDGGTSTINENLNVSGHIVCDTLEANQIVSDIEVKDPLVHVAYENPSDDLNIGIFGEYESSGKKFTGLIRNRTDKSYYLSNNDTTLPTATGAISNRQGSLKLGNLDVLQTTIGTIGSQYTLPNARAGIVSQVLVASDLTGAVEWQNSNFNQTLNTIDDVEFNKVTTIFFNKIFYI